jgi:hypothetical protein
MACTATAREMTRVGRSHIAVKGRSEVKSKESKDKSQNWNAFCKEPKLPSCRDHSFWHQRINRVCCSPWYFWCFCFRLLCNLNIIKDAKERFETTNACIPAKSLQIFANLQMLVHSCSFWLVLTRVALVISALWKKLS